jgi:carbon-monoxide dehydrogenase medium subunit
VGYSSLLIATDSWAIARAAVWVRAGATVEAARVVLGCVAATPVRASATEAALTAKPADADTVAVAAALAGEGLEPPSDPHASASYRREMSSVMVKRALLDALSLEGGGR